MRFSTEVSWLLSALAACQWRVPSLAARKPGGSSATAQAAALEPPAPHGTGVEVPGSATDSMPVASTAPSSQATSVDALAAVQRPRTRLQDGIRRHKIYMDGTVKYGMLAVNGEPNDLNEALNDDN